MTKANLHSQNFPLFFCHSLTARTIAQNTQPIIRTLQKWNVPNISVSPQVISIYRTTSAMNLKTIDKNRFIIYNDISHLPDSNLVFSFSSDKNNQSGYPLNDEIDSQTQI